MCCPSALAQFLISALSFLHTATYALQGRLSDAERRAARAAELQATITRLEATVAEMREHGRAPAPLCTFPSMLVHSRLALEGWGERVKKGIGRANTKLEQ